MGAIDSVKQLDAADIEAVQRREKRMQAVDEVKATAMPLTFGRVFWAVLLANLVSAIIIGLLHGIK